VSDSQPDGDLAGFIAIFGIPLMIGVLAALGPVGGLIIIIIFALWCMTPAGDDNWPGRP